MKYIRRKISRVMQSDGKMMNSLLVSYPNNILSLQLNISVTTSY